MSGGLPHLEHNMTLKNADHRLKFWPRPQKQRFLSSRRRFQNVRLHLFVPLPKCRRHTLIHQDGLGYIFQRSDFRPLLHPQRRTWRLPAIRRVRWNIWAGPGAWRVRPCRRKLRERWVFRLQSSVRTEQNSTLRRVQAAERHNDCKTESFLCFFRKIQQRRPDWLLLPSTVQPFWHRVFQMFFLKKRLFQQLFHFWRRCMPSENSRKKTLHFLRWFRQILVFPSVSPFQKNILS